MPRRKSLKHQSRRGIILPTLPFVVILMVCILALAIDLCWCYSERHNLQQATDAAALAAAMELRQNQSSAAIRSSSRDFALLNEGDSGEVLKNADITIAHWNSASRQLQNAGPLNAVRVIARRDGSGTSKQISTFFMGFFGFDHVSSSCTSIASFEPISASADLLFDDDTIDASLPGIIQLANSLGRSPESLVMDGNNDGFIDIPPGSVVSLPAGTPDHPGVFELGKEFPYGNGKDYTLHEFMTTGTALQTRAVPLQNIPAIRPVGDQTLADLPRNSTFIAVVFQKDIFTTSEKVGDKTLFRADLQIPRAGLLAFDIQNVVPNAATRSDLKIKVANPADIDLQEVGRRFELRPVIRVK